MWTKVAISPSLQAKYCQYYQIIFKLWFPTEDFCNRKCRSDNGRHSVWAAICYVINGLMGLMPDSSYRFPTLLKCRWHGVGWTILDILHSHGRNYRMLFAVAPPAEAISFIHCQKEPFVRWQLELVQNQSAAMRNSTRLTHLCLDDKIYPIRILKTYFLRWIYYIQGTGGEDNWHQYINRKTNYIILCCGISYIKQTLSTTKQYWTKQ